MTLGQVYDYVLLVAESSSHGLFQIHVSAATVRRIPLSSNQPNPFAVTYDPWDSKIYWTDIDDKRIRKSNLDGSDEEVVYSLDSGTCSFKTSIKIKHSCSCQHCVTATMQAIIVLVINL